jgi:hypothetical protein
MIENPTFEEPEFKFLETPLINLSKKKTEFLIFGKNFDSQKA